MRYKRPQQFDPNRSTPGAWSPSRKFTDLASKSEKLQVAADKINRSQEFYDTVIAREDEEIFLESSLDLPFLHTDILVLPQLNPSESLTFAEPLIDEDNIIWEHGQRRRVVPSLMLGPLLDDSAELDFSILKDERSKVNTYAAAPFAQVYNPVNDGYESSLMNLLKEEIDNLDAADVAPKRSFWGTLKELSFGLTDDEYNKKYPWAKYAVRGLSENSDAIYSFDD